jgi:hypothetical protein
MTDIICPLCGKPNPPDLDECQFCQAPLKTTGFLAPAEGEDELDNPVSSSGKKGETSDQSVISATPSNLEQSIPDWLKETEANFLDQSGSKPTEGEPEEPSPDQISNKRDSTLNPPPIPPGGRDKAIDDDWLANLLAEAGVDESAQSNAPEESAEERALEPAEEPAEVPAVQPSEEPPQEVSLEQAEASVEEPPEEEQVQPAVAAEKPDWLTSLEASSKIKLEGGMPPAEQPLVEPAGEEAEEEKAEQPPQPPDWLKIPASEETGSGAKEPEPQLSPAELPGWLEALRPTSAVSPSGPVEDVSNADIVIAGPLVGLRGVISPHPSAIRARKPPTYSIKLRVTDEQKARVEMMEELLADEEKPTPLPTQPIISSRNIFRVIVAVALLLPIFWMIISGRQNTPPPQSGNIPGVVDFTQEIQKLPNGAVVLVAFDYEAGFSGELNVAITNVITQLMNKSAYLALVATNPTGPALGESTIKNVSSSLVGNTTPYSSYANLGYIPGGTIGLSGLAKSPMSVVPYSLNGDNVWAGAPLNAISSIKDFNAVIVLTNDSDTARIWVEQVGPLLREASKPLLVVSSSQASPLILPYYEASPSQVQGLISGLAGGVAYARSVGNIQQSGVWDAYSIGITISILIILIGSIASGVVKMLPAGKKKEN